MLASHSNHLKHVVIVEDNEDTSKILQTYLEHAGYQVSAADNGEDGLSLILEVQPCLAIIDWMLPKKNGIELLETLRANETTKTLPVIILTAKGEERDRLLGFATGADDYVAKPFSPREVIARVKALIKRSYAEVPIIQVGTLQIRVAEHQVLLKDKAIELTQREFELLLTLASNLERVFSRQELLERVWQKDFFGVERVVDVHISNLRLKLEKNNQQGFRFHTVRGVGYALKKTT